LHVFSDALIESIEVVVRSSVAEIGRAIAKAIEIQRRIVGRLELRMIRHELVKASRIRDAGT
jgi:hypothetical protein